MGGREQRIQSAKVYANTINEIKIFR